MKKNIFLSLLAIPILFSACSINNIVPKKDLGLQNPYITTFSKTEKEKLSKEYRIADKIYQKIHSDYTKSIDKVEDLGLYLKYNNNIGTRNSLAWYYGPNLSLSKSDIEIMGFVNNPTLVSGYGLNKQIVLQFNKLFPKKYSIEEKAKELGFSSFHELFQATYARVTNSSENDFIDLIYNLRKNNIIHSKWIDIFKYTDSEPLIKNFFKEYIKYRVNENNIFFVYNGKKYTLSKYDFTNYYFTMFIVNNFLENAKSRSDLYVI